MIARKRDRLLRARRYPPDCRAPLGLLNAVSGGQLYHGRRMSKPGEWLFDLRGLFPEAGMKPKMIEIRSCGKTFEMSVRDLTDWQLDRLLEQNADRAAIDPAQIDLLRKEQAWRREAASEHTFTDTNRHLVEVPDSFAVARWSRNADVATIARCILGTLKYEPHTADTAALRQALETVIKNEVGSLRRVPVTHGSTPALGSPGDSLDRADGRTQIIEEEGEWTL